MKLKSAEVRRLANEYVTGDLSFRELAEKYGYTKGQVNHHGSRNHWAAARAAYRDRKMRDAVLSQKTAADNHTG